MAKRYIRINFANRPSVATPVNATTLNKLDKGIDDCDNAIEDLYSVKFDKANITGQSSTNDANKVPSSQVTYAQGQAISIIDGQITTINNALPNIFIQNKTLGELLSNPTSLTDIRSIISQIPSGIYIAVAGTGELSNIIFPTYLGSGLLINWVRMQYFANGYYYGILTIRDVVGTNNKTYICSIYNNTAYSDWSESGA